ncbi:hypothetical protein BH09PLA1_BH09PLA1_18030 [soil metagenome]
MAPFDGFCHAGAKRYSAPPLISRPDQPPRMKREEVWKFMSDLNDPQIDAQMDAQICGHLNDQLDGHLGAASRRFAEEIARTSRNNPAIPLVEKTKRPRAAGPKFGSFWSISLVGAALAATMTIVSMRHTTPFRSTPMKNRGGNVLPNPDVMPPQPVAYPGEANVAWKTTDQGVVTMPDGSRARQFKRAITDTRKFTDPKTKRTYEYITPSEETFYVGLKQY